ncbi:hypothetical protein H2O64_07895 [Kordia sp. YSTF-M3]|uniref:ThuA-like domain-containing protein n=1 Tax=Kordia aestuariivivens TaxID=2759037 RepID=A0ABR7Q7P5_9FLAO|nr:hypothetical protein [Kordia aestuariivivens]MBC8754592.1 hypothetical protein [Kordia aestuariivivens]
MKILFDRYGQQVQVQLNKKDRLTGMFNTLDEAGYVYDIAAGALSSSALAGYDVLILTTRMDNPFETDELAAITAFVKNGGGLWCMANHSGFNLGNINNNHVRYTGSVCSTFWSAYEAAAYSSTDHVNNEVTLTGANLSDHPTISGKDGWPIVSGGSSTQVDTIVTRSFCAVYTNAFTDTITLLENLDYVENTQSKLPITNGVMWSIGLSNAESVGSGRVVICGDSGWLGDTDSNWPGPGEYQNGDNAQYMLNTVTWLSGA